MIRMLPTLLVLAAAAPAAAHEGHGEPGLMHGFSGEHGLALLAAILVMAATLWLRAPLARLGARVSEPLVRLIARYRSRR